MTKTDLIIPIWEGNNKNEIKKSLNSIFSENNLINKIILIIDGCEKFPDNLSISSSLQKKIIIIYLYKNYGPGYARNIGVLFSEAENIIFLDNGDKCSSIRIKTQIKALESNDVSYGIIKEINDQKRSFIRFASKNIKSAKRMIPYRTPFNNVTMAIKRKKFLELNGYPFLRTAEDWLFMGKVIQNNLNISFEDKILVEVAKDKSFLSRRRGINVYKDINLCINTLYKMGLINKYERFISLNLQKLFRLYLPNNFLIFIYSFFRKKVN